MDQWPGLGTLRVASLTALILLTMYTMANILDGIYMHGQVIHVWWRLFVGLQVAGILVLQGITIMLWTHRKT
jgi:hypothetical protein